MLLRDMYCQICETESEIDSKELETISHCKACNKTTSHKSICNGGTKKRYRFQDWDGVDFSGQCEVTTGVSRFDEQGTEHKQKPKELNNKERRNEKREQLKFNLHRR